MNYLWAEHRVFPAGDGAILFGVDHASLFFIDAQTREVLQRLGSRPSLNLSETAPQDREILSGLREARFLRPEITMERPAPVLPDPQGIPLATMVLEVAQDCNLRCTYCYAEGGGYGGERRLLTPQTARKAVRLLLREAADREVVTLVLFGGEPLLNMPAVKAAIEEAVLKGGEAGKKVQISLTTNGTLLSPEIIAFLHHHRVGVSISLDGPPDLHDANRPDISGRGSYTRILPKLLQLLHNTPAPVGARVTLIPNQWSRIEEVYDHLISLGFHEVGIAPASPITNELLPDSDQEEILLQGFATMARRFKEEAEKGRILPFSNILDLLGRLHLGQTKSIACGAGFGYLAVDAAGDFFPCHRLAGEEIFRVGDLDSGIDMHKISASLATLTEGKAQMCSDCWARTLCAGGCHYENHLRETKLGMPPGGSCHFIRSWLQLGIELYAELRRTGAEALLERLEKRIAG
ncbi:radical SAM/SPASM domain-containing protein [Geopsychrobacter electrodiphilus]|uniref:radical SAM/SPASM domain-containing protein n=1 Tax=Geopsychrobacter electrodiphilus TaxID=225196 RepID=UPI0003779EEE|nr:radical SAM protein [Geopsychrobacter electrodiphilus]